MTTFAGPLSDCGSQRYIELQAMLDMDEEVPMENFYAYQEALEEVFFGCCGHGRGFRLMKPELFAKRPRRAYNVRIVRHTVQIDVKKKCFVIRKSPPAVAGCRNPVNRQGDLTIGFGAGKPPAFPASMAHTKKPWKLVLEVLGISENDLLKDEPNTQMEEGPVPEMPDEGYAAGSDNDCSNDDSDPEMPGLTGPEVTTGSLPVIHPESALRLRAVQEGCLTPFTFPGLWRQAMQVYGGSSTDLPGSSNAGAFSAVGETPHLIHQQVTAGYCPLQLSETAPPNRPAPTERYTVYTTAPRAEEAQQCLRTCMSCETLRCKREFGHYGMHNCGSYRCRPIYVQEDDEENF